MLARLLPLLCLLPTLALADEPAWLDEIPAALEQRNLCMADGLRVIIRADPGSRMATTTSVYGRGSAMDPDGSEGRAHLLEHAWFRSAREGREVGDVLRDLGASYQGYTELDATAYRTIAPVSSLDGLLALESARLEDALAGVSEDHVAVEKGVVDSERKQRREGQIGGAIEALWSQVYGPEHPYHGVETASSIASVTLAQLSAASADTHTSDQSTWIVTADLSLAELSLRVGAARKTELADASVCVRPPIASLPLPPGPTADFVEEEGDIDVDLAAFAWPLPALTPTTSAVAGVVAQILEERINEHRGNRANQCWVEENNRGALLTCAIAMGRHGITDLVIRYALEALKLEEWQTYGTFVEREAVVMELLASADRSRTLDLAAFDEIFALSRWDARPSVRSSVAVILAIDDDEIDIFASKYLTSAPAQRSIRPRSKPVEERPISAAAKREIQARLVREESPVDRAELETLIVQPDIDAISEVRLGNGLRVLMWSDPKATSVVAGLLLPGGEAREPKLGLARMSWWLQDPVYGQLGDNYIQSEAYVSGLETASGPEGRFLLVSAAPGAVAPALKVLAFGVQQMVDLHQLEEYDEIGSVPQERASEDEIWRSQHVTGQHPSFRVLSGPLQNAMHFVEIADVKRWSNLMADPTRATLLLVGAFDADSAATLEAGKIGSWRRQGGGAELVGVPAFPKPRARAVRVFESAEPMAEVQLSCQLSMAPEIPDSSAFILSRALEARLTDTLRSRLGSTYGVFVQAAERDSGHTLLEVHFAIDPARIGVGVETLLGELARFHAAATAADIAVQKRSIAREYGLSHQTPAAKLALLAAASRTRDVGSTLLGVPAVLDRATPEAVAARLAPCFGHEAITVAGPVADALTQLKASGIPAAVLEPQN